MKKVMKYTQMEAEELKEIQDKYDIPCADLAYYLGYSKEHIVALRGKRFPISVKFQLALCNFLINFRNMDFEEATKITKLQ